MAIQVLINFGGVETGEKRILPGLYPEDDPQLLGLGGYLVEHGWAKRVKTAFDEPAFVQEVESQVVEPDELAGPDVSVPETTATSIHHLNLSAQALSALADLGIGTLEELQQLDDDELLEINGIGPATVEKIRSA